ncbi:hypothetical protein L0664_09240 [Octadecabacter sp. G9-8]|uniref:LTD domain-containing protein n=1 Tax=Octadecabacter dasysiphoniae TaxID=2909341 RepID=A0ABS9CXW4_9RHOB|nr:hypothetical protein [Octadecabacter dasysiphoniae]MCF2871245.1 hypothetical protein [Octadecabacter dasysiphoniae]
MSVADLKITELLFNTGPTGFQFIEVTNTGATAVSSQDFFVGNDDFGPAYFEGNFGPDIQIAAGASIVLVPVVPDFSEEVFEPPVPVTQAEFEAVYGPLPAGAVFLSYPAFLAPVEGNLFTGNTSYTIGGNDVFGDSVFIPDGGTVGQSAQIDSAGVITFGTPTPGATGLVVPVGPTSGDDVLFGGDAPTTIDLMDGNDTWTGVASTDEFVVGMYIDSILGGSGDDSIFGGLGNDLINAGRDNDLVDAGEGNDKVWAGQGDDEVYGGTGADRLNGNSGDDEIYGGNGGDIIRGGKGEDYIEGGGQSDKIWGGSQADEIYGDTGNDYINGGAGFDLLFGGSGHDDLYGGTFDDVLYGGTGSDRLNGGSGDDELHGERSNDRLNGNSGDDSLYGGSGNDKLWGGSEDDVLFGGSQSDTLNGGTGEDILVGGLGNDILNGGQDADTFVFAGVTNSDIIEDFETGIDKIDFTAYGPVSDLDAVSIASQVGDDVVLDLGAQGDITLKDTNLADLSLDDFIYISDDIFVVG